MYYVQIKISVPCAYLQMYIYLHGRCFCAFLFYYILPSILVILIYRPIYIWSLEFHI